MWVHLYVDFFRNWKIFGDLQQFENDLFSSLLYYKNTIYEICLNLLFKLSVRLPVNSRKVFGKSGLTGRLLGMQGSVSAPNPLCCLRVTYILITTMKYANAF